jgi:hypothetical protein
MSTVGEQAQGQTSLMGRLFRRISAWFAKISRKIRELFSPKGNPQSVADAASDGVTLGSIMEHAQVEAEKSTTTPSDHSTDGEATSSEASKKGYEPQVLLGSLQTMIATPPVPVEAPREPESVEVQSYSEADRYEEEYVPKIKPKPSPPLPKEHRDLVRRLVRAGKRKEAAQQLEELGYLFPEVSTRGKYIVVKYRGRDGYLYAARIKYKA